jgi:hypothetical protein
MAGVAAERTLLLLRDAVELALPEDKRTAFRSKTEGRAIKRVFDEIWNRLNPVHDKLASDLHKEDVRAELSGAFDLIRKTRNDAGHPTKRDITREEAHGVLLLFPGFCQIAYRTIGWLRSNPF